MATLLRVQCNLGNNSNLAKDRAMNTWHFWSGAVDPQDDIDSIDTALSIFYQSIDGFFSPCLSGDLDIVYYDLTDAEPRAPLRTAAHTVTPGSDPQLPAEVAICLSYAGIGSSGFPPARRRGRFYLGPLNSSVIDDGANDAVIQGSVRGAICNAAEVMMGLEASSTAEWRVFSPTTAGAPPWSNLELGAASLPVISAYVDDAFDTVRSRGVAATARTTVNYVP